MLLTMIVNEYPINHQLSAISYLPSAISQEANPLETRTYHGPATARGLAEALLTAFNQGHLIAQANGDDDPMIVQIASREMDRRGQVRAALTVTIARQDDALEVSLGEHQWLGAAADLVQAGLFGWFRPLSLLGSISSMSDDLKTLALPTEVWKAIDAHIESVGATLGMAADLKMVACPYCGVGNPVGVGQCSACGGSLAKAQPKSCPQCGKASPALAAFCARCGTKLE